MTFPNHILALLECPRDLTTPRPPFCSILPAAISEAAKRGFHHEKTLEKTVQFAAFWGNQKYKSLNTIH